MISKGKARADARQLGAYLIDNAKKENETVRVLHVRSGVTQDVKAALLDMELANDTTQRGEKPLYHMQISPAKGEDFAMTLEDWLYTADEHEKALGFDDQDRVIVLHEKRGEDGELRLHAHVVWSRVKDGKLLSISHNYRKHDFAREKSEITLGHKRTMQPKDIKQTLTQLWQNSIDGQDFVTKAQEKGYQIGRDYITPKGGTRPYCVLTPDGQSLDLVRQLDKVNTAAVKERFKDIEASLPTGRQLEGQKREREKHNKRRYRTTNTAERTRSASERKKAAALALQMSQDKAIFQQKAQEAGENFAAITARLKPETDQAAELATQADKLQEFKSNQKPGKTKEETARQAGQNFKDITREETDDEREIREAFELLRDDDFGLEHEID